MSAWPANISARGQNSIAVRSTGDVSGAMVLQGTIVATGYRFTTPPADPSKLDADDLLQGGPAVSIEGNVAKGIILAIPPKDNSTTDNDEDDDGIEDAKEGSASITSYGSAAALRIGSAGAHRHRRDRRHRHRLRPDRRRRHFGRRSFIPALTAMRCRSAAWAGRFPSPTASA